MGIRKDIESKFSCPTPVARTVEATCNHYGWSRTFVFKMLGEERLKARKAGKRTLILTETSDQLFASLPEPTYRTARAPSTERNNAALA